MINQIIPLLNPPPWGRTLLLLSFSKIYNSGWGIFSIIVSLFSICVFIIVLFHFFCFILILFGTIMEINLGRQNSYFLSSKSLEKANRNFVSSKEKSFALYSQVVRTRADLNNLQRVLVSFSPIFCNKKAEDETRTRDSLLGRQVLYH